MDVAATARREAAKAQAARTEAEAAAEQTRAYAENAVGELKQRVSMHIACCRLPKEYNEGRRSALRSLAATSARTSAEICPPLQDTGLPSSGDACIEIHCCGEYRYLIAPPTYLTEFEYDPSCTFHAPVQIAQIQSEKAASLAQSEQLRSALEAKTGEMARMTGQLADAQANAHSMSQRVSAAA